MSEARAFPATDVLGAITGRLIGDIGGVYEVCNYMTGESVYTHQLPRICREAQPVIVALHPELQAAVEESEQITRENWQTWRDLWIERYGPEIAVPRFDDADHERIDPLSELAQMTHPDNIIVVSQTDEG